jgi:hypothetical protein
MTADIRWRFPKDLLAKSLAVMKPHGAHGNEGLALWLGRKEEGAVAITHVISISGRGVRNSPLQLRLSLTCMEAITNLADKVKSYLVGQIHSHPARMLDLSEVDKIYGIRIQNYLSLVCPYYAQISTLSIEECGVHLFDQGNYRRFHGEEVRRRIHLTQNHTGFVTLEVDA